MKCMQAQTTLISVEEYLNTSFPNSDCEYVDGVVVERNLGERDHSRLQRKLIGFFVALENKLGTFGFPEQRVQVKQTRFRVPDVCVYLEEPNEQIFTTPPFLVIEILSRDDRASDLQEKIDDYLEFGVPYVWTIDPRRRLCSIHTADGSHEPKDRILRTHNPDINASLEDLFA
jgi:Uma2 family endonuclease